MARQQVDPNPETLRQRLVSHLGEDHDTTPFPLQLRSYGNTEVLTQRPLGQLRAWDAAGRPRERLEIVVYPLDAEVDIPNDAVVMSKRWHQFVLRWR